MNNIYIRFHAFLPGVLVIDRYNDWSILRIDIGGIEFDTTEVLGIDNI
jgi:hypothetical protein